MADNRYQEAIDIVARKALSGLDGSARSGATYWLRALAYRIEAGERP